jgi:signal transduction histidine kinase
MPIRRPISIRGKITLGFYVSLLIIFIVTMVNFYNLLKVDKKVEFSEVINDFVENTLEARRFEKNFFLFGKDVDYLENQRYVEKALELLDEYPEDFEDVTRDNSVAIIAGYYREYDGLMDSASEAGGGIETRRIEALVRDKGKEITSIAENVATQERRNIRELLKASQVTLWVSLALIVVVGVIMGRILATSIIKPLKFLECYTEKVSSGEFVRYEGGYRELEVESLMNAFNRMISELEIRQRQLVRTEKLASLGTLLSGVAHELNNPLSNISTSAQIMSEEIEDCEVEYKKQLLAQIEEQTDKARDIVKSLLEFSREKEFRAERFGILKMLLDTRMLLRGKIPTGVALIFDVPGDLEITADRQRLQQVFINLIGNALDAAGDEGRVEVRSSESVDEDGAKFVEIDVIDNGAGMDRERLMRIFDPFYTTKDVGQGSGLGLFIVHDIIERHDGSIKVTSEPGEGTTFHIRLKEDNTGKLNQKEEGGTE